MTNKVTEKGDFACFEKAIKFGAIDEIKKKLLTMVDTPDKLVEYIKQMWGVTMQLKSIQIIVKETEYSKILEQLKTTKGIVDIIDEGK